MAYAEDCKSFYTGSIPVPASKKRPIYEKKIKKGIAILFFLV